MSFYGFPYEIDFVSKGFLEFFIVLLLFCFLTLVFWEKNKKNPTNHSSSRLRGGKTFSARSLYIVP